MFYVFVVQKEETDNKYLITGTSDLGFGFVLWFAETPIFVVFFFFGGGGGCVFLGQLVKKKSQRS